MKAAAVIRIVRFTFSVLSVSCLASVSHAQTAPADPLQTANTLYFDAKFRESADVLKQAISSGTVAGSQMVAARELLARSLAKAGDRLEAQGVFKSMLQLDPQYRPDPLKVPPDEMEVFNLAKAEFDAEQLEKGKRIPASITLFFGGGSSGNSDLAQLAESQGGDVTFSSNGEYGGSIRFPIRPRWSLDVELRRLQAEADDNLDPTTNFNHVHYTAQALPLIVSLSYTTLNHTKWRLNSFAGVGAMISQGILEFTHFHSSSLIIPVQMVGTSTGPYLEAGVEGEYLVIPRLSVTGQLLGRYANSGSLDWRDSTYPLYAGVPIGDSRSVDFSGWGASIGLRAYIGY